jgi:D-mannonate dehydratase
MRKLSKESILEWINLRKKQDDHIEKLLEGLDKFSTAIDNMTPEELQSRVDNSKVKDKFENYATLEKSVAEEPINYFTEISKVAEKYGISIQLGDQDWPKKIYQLLVILEDKANEDKLAEETVNKAIEKFSW